MRERGRDPVGARGRRGALQIGAAVLLLAGGAPACWTVDPLDPTAAVADLLAPGGEVRPVVLVHPGDTRPWPRDPWTFADHRFQGDTLHLDIRYGGGCRVHRFAFLVHLPFRESHPVQADATLAHDADGDLCRALISETLSFDLRPLRAAWYAAYGAGPGAIHLLLDGRRLEYRF